MARVITSLVAEDIIKQLNNYSKEIIEKLDEALEEAAGAIEQKAVSRAPFDDFIGSTIRDQIVREKIGEHGYSIKSNSEMSAYYEFGTGKFVFEKTPSLPEDIKDYAWLFFIDGSGTIRQHPYLFNSYLEERAELIEKVKKIVGG